MWHLGLRLSRYGTKHLGVCSLNNRLLLKNQPIRFSDPQFGHLWYETICFWGVQKNMTHMIHMIHIMDLSENRVPKLLLDPWVHHHSPSFSSMFHMKMANSQGSPQLSASSTSCQAARFGTEPWTLQKKDCGQRSKTSGVLGIFSKSGRIHGGFPIYEKKYLYIYIYMKHMRLGDQHPTSDMFPSAELQPISQGGHPAETSKVALQRMWCLKSLDSPANFNRDNWWIMTEYYLLLINQLDPIGPMDFGIPWDTRPGYPKMFQTPRFRLKSGTFSRVTTRASRSWLT